MQFQAAVMNLKLQKNTSDANGFGFFWGMFAILLHCQKLNVLHFP